MTEHELVAFLKTCFGKKRIGLRPALQTAIDNLLQWDAILAELKDASQQQSVMMTCGVTDDTIARVNDFGDSLQDIDDCSVHVEIDLTPNNQPEPFNNRFATVKAGHTLRVCEIWFSVLVPFYTLDCYHLSYDRKDKCFNRRPYKSYSKYEKKLINNIHDVMIERDITFCKSKVMRRRMRNAVTYCKPEGYATVFDCLFTATGLPEGRISFTEKHSEQHSPGAKVWWRDYYNSNDKMVRKEILKHYADHNGELAVINSKGQMTQHNKWQNQPDFEPFSQNFERWIKRS